MASSILVLSGSRSRSLREMTPFSLWVLLTM